MCIYIHIIYMCTHAYTHTDTDTHTHTHTHTHTLTKIQGLYDIEAAALIS